MSTTRSRTTRSSKTDLLEQSPSKESSDISETTGRRTSSRLKRNSESETDSSSKLLSAANLERLGEVSNATARPKRSSSRASQISVTSEDTSVASASQKAGKSNSQTSKLSDAENVSTRPTRSSSRLSQISEAESTESFANVTVRRYGTRSKKTDDETVAESTTAGRRSSTRLSQATSVESAENLSSADKLLTSRSTRASKQSLNKEANENVVSEPIYIDSGSESDASTASTKKEAEKRRESRRLSSRVKSTLEDIKEVPDEFTPTRRSTRLRKDSETSDTEGKSTRSRARKSMVCSTLDKIPDEEEIEVKSSPKKERQDRPRTVSSSSEPKIDKEGTNATEDSGQGVGEGDGNKLYSLISSEITRVSSTESLTDPEEKSDSKTAKKEKERLSERNQNSEPDEIQTTKPTQTEKRTSPRKSLPKTKECVVDLFDFKKSISCSPPCSSKVGKADTVASSIASVKLGRESQKLVEKAEEGSIPEVSDTLNHSLTDGGSKQSENAGSTAILTEECPNLIKTSESLPSETASQKDAVSPSKYNSRSRQSSSPAVKITPETCAPTKRESPRKSVAKSPKVVEVSSPKKSEDSNLASSPFKKKLFNISSQAWAEETSEKVGSPKQHSDTKVTQVGHQVEDSLDSELTDPPKDETQSGESVKELSSPAKKSPKSSVKMSMGKELQSPANKSNIDGNKSVLESRALNSSKISESPSGIQKERSAKSVDLSPKKENRRKSSLVEPVAENDGKNTIGATGEETRSKESDDESEAESKKPGSVLTQKCPPVSEDDNEGEKDSDSEDPELISLNFSDDSDAELSSDSENKKTDAVSESLAKDLATDAAESESLEIIEIKPKESGKRKSDVCEIVEGIEESSESSKDSGSDRDESCEVVAKDKTVLKDWKNKENKRVSFSDDVVEPKKSTLSLLSDPQYVSKINNYINDVLQSRQKLKEVSKLSHQKVPPFSKKVEKTKNLGKDKPAPGKTSIKPENKSSKDVTKDNLSKTVTKDNLPKTEDNLPKTVTKDNLPKTVTKPPLVNLETTDTDKPLKSVLKRPVGEDSNEGRKKLALGKIKPGAKPAEDSSIKSISNDQKTKSFSNESSFKGKSTSNSSVAIPVEKATAKRKIDDKVTSEQPKKLKFKETNSEPQECKVSFLPKQKKPKTKPKDTTEGPALKQNGEKTKMGFQISDVKGSPTENGSLFTKRDKSATDISTKPRNIKKIHVVQASCGKFYVVDKPEVIKPDLKRKANDLASKWDVKSSSLQNPVAKGIKIPQTFTVTPCIPTTSQVPKFGKTLPNSSVPLGVPRSIESLVSNSVSNSNDPQGERKKKKKRNKKRKLVQEESASADIMNKLMENFLEKTKKSFSAGKFLHESKTLTSTPARTETEKEDFAAEPERKAAPVSSKGESIHKARHLDAKDVFYQQKTPSNSDSKFISSASDDVAELFAQVRKKKSGSNEHIKTQKFLPESGRKAPFPKGGDSSKNSNSELSLSNKDVKSLPKELMQKLSHQPQSNTNSYQENGGKRKRKRNRNKGKGNGLTGGAPKGLQDDFIPLLGSSSKFKVAVVDKFSNEGAGISHFKNQQLQRREKNREPVKNIIAYRQKMGQPGKSRFS